MPLPAAWKPMHYVGSSRGQGSDAAPYSHAEIRGSIWSRQPTRRTVGDRILSQVRCPHVLGLSEEIAPPQAMRPAPCPCSRQRPISPCHNTAAVPRRNTSRSIPAIFAALQPGTESRRESLEAGQTAMHSQSILSTTERSYCRCNTAATAMEKTKQHSITIMRHYLSRYV
jgi:hypothetical protein